MKKNLLLNEAKENFRILLCNPVSELVGVIVDATSILADDF